MPKYIPILFIYLIIYSCSNNGIPLVIITQPFT